MGRHGKIEEEMPPHPQGPPRYLEECGGQEKAEVTVEAVMAAVSVGWDLTQKCKSE